ncbi:MAG: T9SS type A sorting domain-containing protein [Bacteroidales bacterium]|nr:T9SS type A sorting domain-containing protein [Bacteroidales bacterium]
MKSVFNFLLISSLMLIISTSLQSQIAIGQWRDHLPYNRALRVADDGQTIYCATNFSLFAYDMNDQSVLRKSKVNGLSDVGISAMVYSDEFKTLVIAYTNTNIDLIKDDRVINISDIKRRQILGNKTINNITLRGNLAYLSCGFGIVVLDIQNEEFPEPTYYIGSGGSQVNVMDITFSPDSIYAATTTGIFKASLSSPNLADFNAWSQDQQMYPNGMFNTICYYENRLLANNKNEGWMRDTVFMYDFRSNLWSIMPGSSYIGKFRILESRDQLVVIGEFGFQIYNSNYEQTAIIDNPGGVALQPRDVVIDNDNFKWIADNRYGLVATDGFQNTFVITPNGPISQRTFDMSLQNEKLWVAAGGRTTSWGKMYIADGVYSFIDESWNTFNSSTGYSAFDTISDMTCIAVNPLDSRQVFVGTWMEGVIELYDNEVANVYSKNNSSLQVWPTANYVAISGVAFDESSNLWVVNSGAPNLLSVKKPDGEWKGFSLGSSASGIDASKLVVDGNNQKWIMVRADHKLVVFSENGTIDDDSDDMVKVLSNSPGNGDLPGNKILCLAEDLDGRMWIGSDQGIAVIYSPGNVFTGGNFDAQRILVEVGGYVQYLLESEVVTSIAVDGDNRKWIGTERAGVFLVSDNGTEQIHHFTEENSPLFSNLIVDIAINNKTGEVFFATDRGIISFKSTATGPNPTNSNVVVYPNPVREGYTGIIAINGLVNKADVKITDISGVLIYATKAEGSQATWNGKSMDGRRASTGVYLVFSTDDEGVEKMVTKILFIN